ncbi:integrin beta-8 [Ambystoma mexicanum]|uniref:integrin beta-8 n=1 Tax=Ambystoma mexicanum TaxID=8296 RepID=UPI0037E90BA0
MWTRALPSLAIAGGALKPCGGGAPAVTILALHLLSLLVALCHCDENQCISSHAATCSTCLSLGAECAWCNQKDFMLDSTQIQRCDIISNLIKNGCNADLIEYPSVQVTVPKVPEANTQVTPKEVSVQLSPGAETNVIVKVRRLEKYPVDLYYLVDVSASMHSNIEQINSTGFELSQKMAHFSHDFRLGFGSFVDKAVSPYISIHPDRIDNQCSDFRRDCMRPHGFIHVLPLTDNVAEFKKAVGKQKVSGNIDAPEGVFDAMLQATVCQREIGWRKEAKRVLLLMTDQTSHLALDSKLAGIVVPNDGECHLKDNEYSRSSNMEHPSLGQLSQKLIENNINAIFAVEGNAFQWYKDILSLLPGTAAKELESRKDNLKELVIDAIQALLSEVKIMVVNGVQGLQVNVSALCPDGTRTQGTDGCKHVKSNEEVLLNISLSLNTCDVGKGQNYILIKPIGFNETSKIMISVNCPCKCNGSRRHNGQCAHEQPTDGEHVDSSENNCSPDKDIYSPESCKLSPDQPTCSGRGICACRNCLCHKTKLGTIYGKYCEMDDFSCPYHDGKMCDGHGECEDGICKCFRGWGGDQCQCPSSTEECMNSKGEICSGRGTCSCGKCWCSEQGSFGRFCEYCKSCTKVCENNWNCLQCHVSHNTSQPLQHHCKTSCTKLIYFLDQTSECFSDSTHFRIFSIIAIITFLVGLLGVLITRQIVLRCSNNKMASSAHYRDSSRMEKVFLPAASSRTVTYTLDKPEEKKIDITKLQVHETFKCKFEDNVLNEGFSP